MTPPDMIRITKEEAASPHVDDLLKRQMSLRGESGVTRSRQQKWFLQGWLVFGLAGLLGAIAAWALLEPIFDDFVYLRGTVEDVQLLRGPEQPSVDGAPIAEGNFVVAGETITTFPRTYEIRPDGSKPRFRLDRLRVGQEIGVYIDLVPAESEVVACAMFVETEPPPGPASHRTLRQLQARTNAAGLVIFGVVAGIVGLFIGAADGLVCRLPRRALFAGGIGMLVGLAGGFVSGIFANLIYAPLSSLAIEQDDFGGITSFGFLIQMGGRALAWALAGCAMGLGQGIALRSKLLLLYGLIGGLLGGLFGGLFFDPIDMLLLDPLKPSAHWSRLVGFSAVGLCAGAMMGVVELLARNAWLRMTQGPLTGKEFLVFKDVMKVGSSPRSDIYLFNDSAVAPDHALLRTVGEECEIEARDVSHPVLLNNRPVRRARLRHGDSVTIGRTVFLFQKRKG